MAAQQGKLSHPPAETVPNSWRLKRRLKPAIVAQIAAKYLAGAMTPAFCEEYGLSKSGVLKLLRDQGVELRCQPLTDEQVQVAIGRYQAGQSLAAIATHLDTSYNNVRQRLLKNDVMLRPRGGSYR